MGERLKLSEEMLVQMLGLPIGTRIQTVMRIPKCNAGFSETQKWQSAGFEFQFVVEYPDGTEHTVRVDADTANPAN